MYVYNCCAEGGGPTIYIQRIYILLNIPTRVRLLYSAGGCAPAESSTGGCAPSREFDWGAGTREVTRMRNKPTSDPGSNLPVL